MDIIHLHPWNLTQAEAIRLQRELATRIDTSTPLTQFETVAGADISYNLDSPTLYASVVVLRGADLSIIETQDVVAEETFPYIPGYLSFRELPPLLQAFAALETRPDVVVCDGQGIAHPRGLGIASHLGLWLNIPTVGCGKSRLCGAYVEPGEEAGSISPLMLAGQRIGSVVRTRTKVKPVFVSPGHRITLADAERVVLACCRGYRLPETTRAAHHRVNELRADEASGGVSAP